MSQPDEPGVVVYVSHVTLSGATSGGRESADDLLERGRRQRGDAGMHARRTASVVDTATSRATSATGNELTAGVNGGKHLICLRDLTST